MTTRENAIASAGPRIGNYHIVLPAKTIRSWKARSSLRIPCNACRSTGRQYSEINGLHTCPVCQGKKEINPYIYGYIGGKQTRVTRLSFNMHLFAWAMLGAPEPVYRMMLCKYAGGAERDHQKLVREAAAAGKQLANQSNWSLKKSREETLELVTVAALSETLQERICHVCDGRGTVQDSGKEVECPPMPRGCGGTGRRARSQRTRAVLCGLHLNAFQKTWVSRYMALLQLFTDWEMDGLSRLYYRLRED